MNKVEVEHAVVTAQLFIDGCSQKFPQQDGRSIAIVACLLMLIDEVREEKHG